MPVQNIQPQTFKVGENNIFLENFLSILVFYKLSWNKELKQCSQ